MTRISKFITIAALSLVITGCATIENPEDCDIRCGFGKNTEFAAQNEDMRKDLEQQELENERIADQLSAAKVTEATLAEREANLRSLLSKQSVRLDTLQKGLNMAMARNQITQARYETVSAKVLSLKNSAKMFQAKPKMTKTEVEGMASLVKDQLVPFFQTAEVVNIIDNMS